MLHARFRKLIQVRLGEENTGLPTALRKIWQVLADHGYAHMLAEMHESHGLGNFTYPRLSPDAPFATRIFLNRLRPIPVFKARRDYFLEEFQENQNPDPEDPKDWYEIEIELVGIEGDHDVQSFRDEAGDWEGTLAVTAHDLTTRLREAMDWLCEFGLASQDSDISHIEYRSISPHEQNTHAHTWTQLVALTRGSYDALLASGDAAAAARLVRRWRSLPYPIFRRLALYAATVRPDD